MSRPKIIFTPTYEESLRGIEDFLYRSNQDMIALEAFSDEHDRVLTFIAENPNTPAVHPATGDLSWPFEKDAIVCFTNLCTAAKIGLST